ncbi:MAG: hypothetical protein ABI402_14300 [Ferruginibacter sp.]
MNFKKIYYIISFLFFVSAGEYIGYWASTTRNTGNIITLFGIIGFAMIVYGFFCMLFIVQVIFEKYTNFIRRFSEPARNFYNLTFFILFVCVTIAVVLPYFLFTKKYTADQYKKFGVMQRVLIEDKHTGYKGHEYVSFRIVTPDSIYDKELPAEYYQPGDSTTIIYSSYDPNIFKWADDFK